MVVKIMVPFLGHYTDTAPNIWGTPKGSIILTTSHVVVYTHLTPAFGIPTALSKRTLRRQLPLLACEFFVIPWGVPFVGGPRVQKSSLCRVQFGC